MLSPIPRHTWIISTITAKACCARRHLHAFAVVIQKISASRGSRESMPPNTRALATCSSINGIDEGALIR
ncbi:MAG: hypothetical protein L0Y71_25025 [Gemmataceae bacterium]|nr:hypothetical protein [Gemmataceae bacterium]